MQKQQDAPALEASNVINVLNGGFFGVVSPRKNDLAPAPSSFFQFLYNLKINFL